jgi:hypothetical protein
MIMVDRQSLGCSGGSLAYRASSTLDIPDLFVLLGSYSKSFLPAGRPELRLVTRFAARVNPSRILAEEIQESILLTP